MAHLLLGQSKPAAGGIGFTARNTDEPLARPILDSTDRPLLTIAPTGAGKGVSALIPAALTWPGSLVVVDVKPNLDSQVQFDEAALERANAMTKATVQAFAVQDFHVRSVDCGRDLCWIRYDYRLVARTATSETKGVAESEEVWVSDGERLLFLIGTGRQ